MCVEGGFLENIFIGVCVCVMASLFTGELVRDGGWS
jgi:hypothetical protein